ncbi:hypothetical protein A2631_04550 [Candidatus Daviesbacteria bacterium RIFCSPHIGHO2_01_FULL_44_29]|uniref:Uncharacterized protein n=1 Tax=Candidatus Daviesbacteria bacterium RIFCSPHIGHO2_02_FULL_43_12 TaxID=1797776 RepID=A0A1F5KHA5_9BACT|nr:MAG: hypothetical protein A2631_04550 [Candidatus Daviesbacteria bacterium RIFCSPHIGHO2_01_FULL_44_29]OGE39609.1 MAG: hypothetical protein A3E86_05705 [Candidatus Daviesbacteria bacterium RIFCSPHIGHO2_12_FULL_47_45]OGE39991.1 MAG: hypothetical protein A3D25_04280 [Candidatus Daviesbacteria bacterium RIFCSPHIGHO2_02_FULL_43_12]OGE70328.1 MAG: hypothetical protein A3B55_01290 [Candidatus Daviesbacteria bacterium RIFCSPLOWO2_01_FULL_43_15]
MRYSSLLTELKNKLPSTKNILVVLPLEATVDELAAGLALYLSLEQSGKETAIVTENIIKVSHTTLFGVGQISSTLPQVSGGNLTISLENVVASDGTVPALEKLDWYPEGTNLNLVFHVLPGQTFQPARITPKYQGGAFDMIFVVGASSLNELGTLYVNNQQSFSNVMVVNIDNSVVNTQFGQVNVVDPNVASVSEIVFQLLPDLGFPVDADIASNVLAGLYMATNNMTTNMKPDTFIVVGQAMQAGGRMPGVNQPQAAVTAVPEAAVTQNVPVSTPTPPAQTINNTTPLIDSNNLPQWLNFAQPQSSAQVAPSQPSPVTEQFTTPPVVNSNPIPTPEEMPIGEAASSPSSETDNPAPDWLTPKIFKSNLE